MMRFALVFAFSLIAGVTVLATMALADEGHGGNPVAGEKVFKKCKVCHALEAGKNKIGPTLHGLFGRKAGAVEGYKYSKAMIAADVVWADETINEYIKKPKEFIKGTKMKFGGLKKVDDRKNLIAYLRKITE
jgi:cytochrome c